MIDPWLTLLIAVAAAFAGNYFMGWMQSLPPSRRLAWMPCRRRRKPPGDQP